VRRGGGIHHSTPLTGYCWCALCRMQAPSLALTAGAKDTAELAPGDDRAELPGVLTVGVRRDNGQPFPCSNWGGPYHTQGGLTPGKRSQGDGAPTG